MPTALIDPGQGRFGVTSLFISPAFRGKHFVRHVIETLGVVGRRYGRFMAAEVPVRETEREHEGVGDGRSRVR